ncbi:hypothetical protein Q8F55_004770 [Vanrija albida]|uniref:Zn(2)-C6 fungal-type domain-containing protein n=1 Tax=Vanrija albida TaxID=181172 RepID=A0ABR3Q0R0_9TREE
MSGEESQNGSGDRSGAALSRACDACRRMKIRCVDRADPPCRRCRTTGSKCEFTLDSYPSPYRIKTNQARVIQMEQRMDNVEKIVRNMEGMMRRFMESQGKTTPRSLASPSVSVSASQPPTTLDDWVMSASSRADDDLRAVTHDKSAEHALPTTVDEDLPDDGRSGSGSRDEDDYLFDAATGAPFKGLLYHDERERLRAKRRREQGGESDSEELPARKRAGSPSLLGASQRLSSTKQSQSLLTSLGGRPVVSGGSGRLQDFMDRAEPTVDPAADPIELGFCSEDEGRHLLELYYQGAHAFLPVFDPATDTWESLRARSPFCVTTILMAGQIAASGSEHPLALRPDLRQKLVAHAESIARDTLFSSVANIESVQAMDHLLNLALDMDLHLCLPHLVQGGMGGGKSAAELERERPLVAGARLWLALCFNYGRPILVDMEEVVRLGRLFLSHPLSNRDDSRCVTLCESFHIRQPINRALRQGIKGRPLDALVSTALSKLEEWERYWLDYYASMGFADDDFLVTERECSPGRPLTPVITIKLYAIVQVSVAFLSEVKSKRDIALLPPSRREVIVSAVRASARLLARAARGAENSKIRHGNRNVRLGLAHAARYLIRMASLIPDAINLREAAKDVELLADQLGRCEQTAKAQLTPVPDFYFSQFLHHVVVEARRKRELPPASALPSRQPSPGPVGPPPEPVESAKTCESTESAATSRLDFDFAVAEDIFASEDWMSIVGGVGANDQPLLDPGAAFPFLPLELSRFPPSDVSELVDHSQLLLSFGQGDGAALPAGGEAAEPAGFWPVSYDSTAL